MSRGMSVLLSSLIALPMLVVLIGLGVWQLQRLEQKQEFMAQRAFGFSQPPVELTPRDSNLQSLAWRRVKVTGRFDHNHEFHLWSLRDGKPGFEVLTPMTRTDNAPGQVVLVDRGWVPVDHKEIATRAEGAVPNAVEVDGFVRIDMDARGPVTPSNDVAKNIWYSVDYAAMSTASALFIRPLVVVADTNPNPGGLPIGIAEPPILPNRHLAYALTWFLLAGTLVVMFGLMLRKQLKGADFRA